MTSIAAGQTLAPTPNRANPNVDLQTLARKIDEQNAKIDLLSQQILKLQQQIAGNTRPGVMIGEGAPTSSPAASTTPEPSHPGGNGNTHIVARGETLTSIAKTHGVTVGELQKLNHIENPLKLQAGQTILIPGPSSSASPSAGE
jgi:LysM repeat protein